MAHFAELDENNKVLRVVVVDNNDIIGVDGKDDENKGIELLKAQYSENTRWVQTSYNNNFRKRYAATGFYYDSQRDAFIPPQAYPSWQFDEETCSYLPPVPAPNDGKLYRWNEETGSWKLDILVPPPKPSEFGNFVWNETEQVWELVLEQ